MRPAKRQAAIPVDLEGSEHARILVVEDNSSLRAGIQAALREQWGQVDVEANAEAAVERIQDPGVEPYAVIVTDLRLPGSDGICVLRAARERDPKAGVILMTAYGSIETAVEAMRLGATDFVQKPFDLEQLEFRVARAHARARAGGSGGAHSPFAVRPSATSARRPVELLGRAGRSPVEAGAGAPELVTESVSMREVIELAERVAPSSATVLLSGETGTGKEVLAGLIHERSGRREGPFVKVNCAALPEPLLESELFGHERGAFTGADNPRRGRFEEAGGGTLLLDEVGDLSPATQAKLLRVLQDREFYRVGGIEPVYADVRVLAATHLDLRRAISQGRFRQDLYFRLNVVEIEIPPLRERPEDAVALAHHFLAEFAAELGRPSGPFADGVLERIRSYPWPGNVRELRNAIERALLMSGADEIDLEHLALNGSPGGASSGSWRFDFPAQGVDLRLAERDLVLAALERADHVQKDAARLLHVTPRKLNYMIQRMGVTHPSWRRNGEK